MTAVQDAAAARRDVHHMVAAYIRLTDPGHADERAAALIDRLISNIKRALAEDLREENPNHSYAFSGGVDWAADLIDPDVKQ